MKIWVLTGDKTETAINIGHSSGLIKNEQIVEVVDIKTREGFGDALKRLDK